MLSAQEEQPHMVRVIHGCNEIVIRPSCTIGAVRRSLREVLNLADDAAAFVNGHEQSSEYQLAAGDVLEFVREHGQKGLGELLSDQDLMIRLQISVQQLQELRDRGLPCLRFKDGKDYYPEVAVDEWFRKLGCHDSTESRAADAVVRIADHFDPPPPDKVGSKYVATLLGCTTTWIADLVRQGDIPRNCIVTGTGNGKPWKFHRQLIEKWIKSR
jgi:hypothetical protein